MGNKKLTRILALCLAAVCLVTTVAALSYDLSGDGKTDVWDLQLAANQGETEAYADALTEALGGGDELHPNGAGVYEIYSVLGLFNMARHATEHASFQLMADIDLGGMDWAPVPSFSGYFNGNGHTISNFTITQNSGINMGFFANVDRFTEDGELYQSRVENLNLADVDLVAAEGTEYIGLVAGTNRGIVENCTATGSITDNRTTLEAKAYIGALVGRNADHADAPGVLIRGEELLTATAGSPNAADKVEGVSAKVAMFFAPLQEGSKTRQTGIAGYSAAANLDTAMIWQDTTGSIEYQSQTEQQRRQGAVDAMYQMGTVQWTTSEELTYTIDGSKTSVHANIYIPGRTYVGLPYNSCGGGYDRFASQMQAEKDDQGRFVTVTGLENGVKTTNVSNQGFILHMGNDCSAAVGWAWAAVAPSRVVNGGTLVDTTPFMVPNDYNTQYYGVLPAGGWQVTPTDAEQYTAAVDARDTRTIIANNGGAQGMAEFYAKSSRGDGLLFVEYELDTQTNTWVKDGGHARLMAYDPMIIRGYNGTIDLDRSYVITHEQGDGLFDNRLENGKYEAYNGFNVKQTSWRTDYKYTLATLLTQEGFSATTRPGCGYGYVPVTIPAFDGGQLRAPYYDPGYTEHPVIAPNQGWYYCNWLNVSATMVITDADGETVYEKTGWVAPGGRRDKYQQIRMEELFPDATDALVAGRTYTYSVWALTGSGVKTQFVKNQSFTYNPATE